MSVERQQNIVRTMSLADGIDLRTGMKIAESYNTVLRQFAEHYRIPFENFVAAFCELTPSSDYVGSLRSVCTMAHAQNIGMSVESVQVTTFGHCKPRAWRWMKEGPEGFLSEKRKAPKIQNFYRTIVQPADPLPVTVDGHLYSVWIGKRMTVDEVAWEKFKYEEVAADYRAVAQEMNLRANQVGGVCWFTHKRVHRILYQPQLSFFHDAWYVYMRPDQIKLLPFKGEKR